MADISFKKITEGSDPLLEQVKPLFLEMYRGMGSQGLMLPLAAGGGEKWLEGIIPTLGRFGVLAVVLEDDNLIGFAHGALKFLPDYLGGFKTGVVTHIFVDPKYRHQKAGLKLLEILEDWFSEKDVHSIELQVIEGNDARGFWQKAGYSLELLQYRKFRGHTK